MHYQIIIISKEKINFKNLYNINEVVKLIDDCTILYNNKQISFDYLIYTHASLVEGAKEIGILTENKIPVTNYFKQTSIENIYYCNDLDISDVLENL